MPTTPGSPSPAHRLLAVLGSNAAVVAMCFGAPIGPRALAAVRDARAAPAAVPRRTPRPRASRPPAQSGWPRTEETTSSGTSGPPPPARRGKSKTPSISWTG
jgi:hypothetical protein